MVELPQKGSQTFAPRCMWNEHLFQTFLEPARKWWNGEQGAAQPFEPLWTCLEVMHQEWGRTQNTWNEEGPQRGSQGVAPIKKGNACCLAKNDTNSHDISHDFSEQQLNMHTAFLFLGPFHIQNLIQPSKRLLWGHWLSHTHYRIQSDTWRDYCLHSYLAD